MEKYPRFEFVLTKKNIFGYVYLLYQGKDVVYVGQSSSIFRRITNHLLDKKFDRVVLYKVPKSALHLLESVLIDFYKPVYNHRRDSYYLPYTAFPKTVIDTPFSDGVGQLALELMEK